MFTGIVEEKGSVRYMQLTGESGVLATVSYTHLTLPTN